MTRKNDIAVCNHRFVTKKIDGRQHDFGIGIPASPKRLSYALNDPDGVGKLSAGMTAERLCE
ncbi:MAG: hypothetical protein AB8B64_23820 [Granulosicoccus sp.]